MTDNIDELEKKLSKIKQTKPRRLVMDVLREAEKPLSAVQILVEIEKTGEQIWLSTIYRILDLFVEKNIAIKSTLLDQDQAVYGLNQYQHTHYAVCIGCHRIITMDNCPIACDSFEPSLREDGFRITGHKIELYGYCSECDKKR